MVELSVVVPVYNSEGILFELNKQIQDALKAYSFELILVNDCSRDNSWKEIRAIAEPVSYTHLRAHETHH